MNARRLRLLRLVDAVGGVFEGKKRLQKIVYIAQRLKYPFDEEFVWHDFGPYSPTLALEMQELEQLRLVESVQKGKHTRASVEYQITPLGRSFLDVFSDRGADTRPLDQLASELHKKRTGRNLELIASIMYHEAHGLSRDESIQTVLELKPQYEGRKSEVEQALADISAIATYARTPQPEETTQRPR